MNNELRKDVAFLEVVSRYVTKDFFNTNFQKIGCVKGAQQRDLFVFILQMGYTDDPFKAFDVYWEIMCETKLTPHEIIYVSYRIKQNNL